MERIDLDAVIREPDQGHTSKGDQPKWQWKGKWYKADYMGYEALSEVLISRLLKRSNVSGFAEYGPVRIRYQGRELPGCVSDNFRDKDEILVPLERLHRAYMGRGLAETLGKLKEAKERIRYTADFMERTTGLTGAGEYLTLLLELDAFFLNEDRHTNNLAVIRNEKTMEFRYCPVFDNGLALLSDLNEYSLDQDIYDCIGRVHAKPFSRYFEEQVDAAEELYGMQLHFFFSKKEISRELEFAGELYDEKICRRAEQVLFEQMRKYRIFFR